MSEEIKTDLPKEEEKINSEIIVSETIEEFPPVNAANGAGGASIIEEEKPEIFKPGKITLFDNIAKKTEEDLKAPEIIKSLAKQAGSGEPENDFTNEEGNKVKASIYVELCDVVFMLLCLLITWDFSDENQKVFTLNGDRKKAIQKSLTDLLNLSSKKPNPKRDIWLLILGSYAPLLIFAVLKLFARLRDKQRKEKVQKVNDSFLNYEQSKEEFQKHEEIKPEKAPENLNKEVINQDIEIPETFLPKMEKAPQIEKKTGKRGRPKGSKDKTKRKPYNK